MVLLKFAKDTLIMSINPVNKRGSEKLDIKPKRLPLTFQRSKSLYLWENSVPKAWGKGKPLLAV